MNVAVNGIGQLCFKFNDEVEHLITDDHSDNNSFKKMNITALIQKIKSLKYRVKKDTNNYKKSGMFFC